MKAKVGDIRINYQVRGEGEYLVLVHGAGDNLHAWFGQVSAFSRRFRVLTPDLRGHGDTDLGDREYSQELWAEDLYGLLKALNVRQAHLLGYSMGGGVVATLALAHPAMAKSLILSNSGGPVGPASAAAAGEMARRRQAQADALEKRGLEGIWELRKSTMFSPGFAEKNPQLMARYREVLLRNNPEGYRRVMASMATRTPPDFSRLNCPTLIFAGEHDTFSGPEAGRAVQRLVARSRLKVFPTGHASAMEMPREYNRTVLGFLARVTGR